MYTTIVVLLSVIAVLNVLFGIIRDRFSLVASGATIVAVLLAVERVTAIWTDAIWLGALGFGRPAWTLTIARAAIPFAGAAAGALVAGALLWPRGVIGRLRLLAVVAGAVLGFAAGASLWDEVLLFLHPIQTGVTDPVFGKDTGFYLFTLPFLDEAHTLLLEVSWICAAIAIISAVIHDDLISDGRERHATPVYLPLLLTMGFLFLVLAAGRFLAVYQVLATQSPDWVQVTVGFPARQVMGVLFAAAGLALLALACRPSLHRRWGDKKTVGGMPLSLVIAPLCLLILPWAVLFLVVVCSRSFVDDEDALRYVGYSIAATRSAYGLDAVQVREVPAAELTRDVVDRNRDLFAEVRLHSRETMKEAARATQALEPFYEFPDLDVDRYPVGGSSRIVYVGTREDTNDEGVVFPPSRSGAVALLPTGPQPAFLLSGLPPEAADPAVALTQAAVVIQTGDAASACLPETMADTGAGDVILDSWWKRLLFSWRVNDVSLLTSDRVTPATPLIFHRQARERVQAIAPFLTLDSDEYVVIHEGRLYAIVDAYTTTTTLPYSAEVSGGMLASEVTSLCNAVKAVVDLADGSVDLYVFAPEDPVIRAWQVILPGLFRPREEMPVGLRAHLRYPDGSFSALTNLYARYHVTDPAAFRDGGQQWQPAGAAMYVMQRRPDGDGLEFVQFKAFQTPSADSGSPGEMAWLVAGCDGDRYGQVDVVIPSSPAVRKTLSGLVRLRMEEVARVKELSSPEVSPAWSVQTIPVEGTLVHVGAVSVPLEGIPSVAFVGVLAGERFGLGTTMDEALESLLTGRIGIAGDVLVAEDQPLGIAALQAFRDWRGLVAEGKQDEAARKLQELEGVLEQLAR